MIIEDTIHIEAPSEVVWAVTEDVVRWPEWTPTVTAVRRLDEGRFGVGSVVRLKQPAQPASDWTVTEYEPRQRFAWETRRAGMHMIASHELREDSSGTLNTLRLEASGILAALLSPLLRPAIRRALREENQGLKARCEAFPASRPST